MKSWKTFGIGLVCVLAAISWESVKADSTVGGGGSSSSSQGGDPSGCNGEASRFSKSQILQITERVVGDSKANCYSKLFEAETSNNAACLQTKVPNPPGIGLCTLEGNPILRERRGGACAVPNSEMGDNEQGVEKQIECCAEIMKKVGNQYYQPVKEGKVPNCETGQTIGV